MLSILTKEEVLRKGLAKWVLLIETMHMEHQEMAFTTWLFPVIWIPRSLLISNQGLVVAMKPTLEWGGSKTSRFCKISFAMHGEECNGIAFAAVAVIVQYQMGNGAPLFEV
jgi:hypothetical protein